MSKAPPAFQFYAADFLTATAELTDEEVGIYLRLLLNQWINGSIPGEMRRMAMLISAGHERLEKEMWPLIGQKFTKGEDGRYRNDRLELVRKEQEEYREKKRIAGEKSGAARCERTRARTRARAGVGTEGGTEGGTNSEQKGNPSVFSLQSSSSVFDLQTSTSRNTGPNGPLSPEDAPPDDAADADAASPEENNHVPGDEAGLPKCPHKAIVAEYHRILPELSRILEWTPFRQRTLQGRWREKKERQNVSWWVQYFQLVRECPLLMGQIEDKDWRADFEWLIRPKNMPKVLEGRYRGRKDRVQTAPLQARTVRDALVLEGDAAAKRVLARWAAQEGTGNGEETKRLPDS